MGNYYYLVAGLPELQTDGQKLKHTLIELKEELVKSLSDSDMTMINYFFMQYDNRNVLKLLSDIEADTDERGTISKEEITEFIVNYKKQESDISKKLYSYLKHFITSFISEEPVFTELNWEDQLTTLYYDYAIKCKNEFIASWFEFNLILTNVLVANNCLKYGIDRNKAIIGHSEIIDSIRISNAKDFGISTIFPEIDEMVRIAEEPDFYERERKIEILKWNWLEDKGFFHFFDMEYLFIYLLKVEMLQRWVILAKASGGEIFREMISKLQRSFEFPNEFTLKKIK